MGGQILHPGFTAPTKEVGTDNFLIRRTKKRGALCAPRNHVIQEEERVTWGRTVFLTAQNFPGVLIGYLSPCTESITVGTGRCWHPFWTDRASALRFRPVSWASGLRVPDHRIHTGEAGTRIAISCLSPDKGISDGSYSSFMLSIPLDLKIE